MLCGQISGQLKSLQIVASLTAERDGDIRKAALNALATGYKILGMVYSEEIHLHNTWEKICSCPSIIFLWLNMKLIWKKVYQHHF